MPFLSWTPYSSTVEDIFAGMHCTIQISAARHIWWGCGKGETRKGNSGWWRKWKNKATLGGFEGINMTPDPGSTGRVQGVVDPWGVTGVMLICLTCLCCGSAAFSGTTPLQSEGCCTGRGTRRYELDPALLPFHRVLLLLWQLGVVSGFLVTEKLKCGLPHALKNAHIGKRRVTGEWQPSVLIQPPLGKA